MRILHALKHLAHFGAYSLLLLLLHPAVARTEERPLALPHVSKQGNVLCEYYRFSLLRYRGQVIALHILPNPAEASRGGICYRWYHLTDGSDTFFKFARDNDDASLEANPSVATGSGETKEVNGTGRIVAGPLHLEWSMGNHEMGWLYLSKVAGPIEFYPEQFDRIEDFSGKLVPERWRRFGREKGQENERQKDEAQESLPATDS